MGWLRFLGRYSLIFLKTVANKRIIKGSLAQDDLTRRSP